MAQRSLRSFFKPVSTKRVSSESPDIEKSPKKPKLEPSKENEAPVETETQPSSSFKPAQASYDPVKSETSIPGGKDADENVTVEGKRELENGNSKSAKPEEGESSKQSKIEEAKETSTSGSEHLCGDGKQKEDVDKKTVVLKDVTMEQKNSSNFSTPPKSQSTLTSMSFGAMSPLQTLAKIKSQCAKTPALHHSIGSSWFFALQSEFSKPYFMKLSQFLVAERKKGAVYPPEDQVWTWTQLCSIKDVKVVILGQDPYHNTGQAHGLCFSVQKGVPPPPSLVNMYKELQDDIPGFKAPTHGNLTGWAKQGVLLLNACLTVRAHAANSHKDQGWEQLTDAVIRKVGETGQGVVFLLWGSHAQKKGACVNKKKHHILTSVHPSPLSAHRGFLGCKHFSKCNELLKKMGKKPIDWAHLPLV